MSNQVATLSKCQKSRDGYHKWEDVLSYIERNPAANSRFVVHSECSRCCDSMIKTYPVNSRKRMELVGRALRPLLKGPNYEEATSNSRKKEDAYNEAFRLGLSV